MYRCSNSNRVAAAPSATNNSATSLARSGSASNFQSGCRCHESTTRRGGSHNSTRPHSHSDPLLSRSYQRPPSFCSTTISLNGSTAMWCVAGHHCPIFSTNTRNAFSMGTPTWIVRFTTAIGAAASGYMFLLLPVFFLNEFFERVQRLVPQICEMIAQQRNSFWIQLVNTPRARLPVAHQPRLFQHP